MCGIAGILLEPARGEPSDLRSIVRVAGALRHRGPDDEGIWLDHDAGISLGHRRLSIVDLSPRGRQPMRSASGRYVITFNGEIYNFRSLSEDLRRRGHRFVGGSDTEVLLAAIESWGIEGALRRSNGMFAFGLWDRKQRVLHLARDRMGEKPLYIARTRNGIVFGSELKALRNFPGFNPALNLDAVAALLSYGWIPEELCIWNNVFKLPPGGLLAIDAQQLARWPDAETIRPRVRRWWSIDRFALNAGENLITAPSGALIEMLDGLLRSAVKERMVADVPIGAFLSGGIDSTTVVALMQRQSSRPVRTFTIGFEPAHYDESANAAAVAKYLGTEHTELLITDAAARDVIPELPDVWDEPLADESQIPTLLVSRLARKSVTVALSGDGGDECFGGYARYFIAARVSTFFDSRPLLRRIAASVASSAARNAPQRLLARMPLPNRMRAALENDRLRRLANLLTETDQRNVYEQMVRVYGAPLVRGLVAPPLAPTDAFVANDLLANITRLDMAHYLPSDILAKVDRATMSASLEARCPFLDHRVVEFSWRVPAAEKVRHGRGKWILRQVLRKYVPQKLFEGPKRGFDVPIGSWLKGPLRGWASDLLEPERLRRQGLLEIGEVGACWRDHISGRRDNSRALWAILMLQAWLDKTATTRVVPAPAAPPELALEGAH